MIRKTLLPVAVALFLKVTSVSAAPDSIVVRGGDLRIRDVGSGLVFPDGSIQHQATAVGPAGPQGPTGPANTLTIGAVNSGIQAGASITGNSPSQVLNLTLPQGPQGPKGDTGAQGPAGGTLQVYDGNNVLLGTYLGIELGGGSSAYVIYLSNGVIHRYSPNDMTPFPVLHDKYYTEINCQGTMYAKESSGGMDELYFNQRGFVLYSNKQLPGDPLYTKLNQKATAINYVSMQSVNTCQNTSGSIMATPVQVAGNIPDIPVQPITIR